MNENTATTYSHARKHLGITFLCGGCYSKLYKVPQHLSQHMKSCPPLPHEQTGGFLTEWEEEVAKLPLPPLAHNNSEALLVERSLVYVCDRDPWPLLSETFGFHFVLFDFWRLRPGTFKCLVYYVTIYN